MGISDLPANDATQPATSGRRLLLLATFTTAIFVSAALLFMVQPMFTKMVLPRLGGAPSVWSVAIVFFQGALLAGYAYAHWLTRYAPGRASVVIHVVVHYSEITCKASFHHTPAHIQKALEFVSQGVITARDFVNRVEPLTNLLEVMRHLMSHNGHMKTAIIP